MLRYFPILFSFAAFAQNGTPDTSFGVSGKLVVDVDELDECVGVEPLNDGGYLFYGQSGAWNGSVFPLDIIIGKITRTGKIDSSFAINGIFRDDFPGFGLCNLTDLAIDSSGIYFYGSGINPGIPDTNEVFVGKLDLTGSLDTNFGTAGYYKPELVGTYNTAGGLILDSEDRIVIVGSTTNQTVLLEYPFVGRLFKNGIPDSTFGSTGMVAWDYFADTLINAIGVEPNFDRHGEGGYLTHLVEVGSSYFAAGHLLSSFNAEALTVMMGKDGNLNTNYNGSGYLIYEPEPGYNFFTQSVHSEGDRLLITLETNGFVHQNHLLVQTIDTTGVLDSLWVYAHTDMTCKAKMLQQVNGDYYLGGYMKDETSSTPGYDSDRFLFMQLDNSGNVQPSFGTAGSFIADMSTGDELGLESFAVSGDQMVLAGYINNIVPGNYVDFAFMGILYDDAVSLDELETASLSIYPNPTNGEVNIQTSEPIEYVEIYSANGQLLWNQRSNRLDFSRQPAGMYLLKVYTPEQVAVQRVLKY